MPEKTCTKCNKVNSLSSFPKKKDCKDGHDSWCHSCANESSKAYYQNNKERARAYTQAWYKQNPIKARGLRIKKFWPGSSWEEALAKYDALFKAQNGRCSICGRHRDAFDREFDIDHNHRTKEVRGLLCNDCNHAIGLLKADDGPVFAERAFKYIESWAEKLR